MWKDFEKVGHGKNRSFRHKATGTLLSSASAIKQKIIRFTVKTVTKNSGAGPSVNNFAKTIETKTKKAIKGKKKEEPEPEIPQEKKFWLKKKAGNISGY